MICKLSFISAFSIYMTVPFSKVSQHYQTVINQRLTVFLQLFSLTSVAPSKCFIDKMIGLQGHLNVWAVL